MRVLQYLLHMHLFLNLIKDQETLGFKKLMYHLTQEEESMAKLSYQVIGYEIYF